MLTPEARQVLQQARKLKKLTEYPEWETFVALISSQCDNWGGLAVLQSKSLDELVEREYPKGVLFGLRLAASLPESTMQARADILAKNPQEREDGESGEDESEASMTGKAP